MITGANGLAGGTRPSASWSVRKRKGWSPTFFGSMAVFEGIDFHEKWGLSLYSSQSP